MPFFRIFHFFPHFCSISTPCSFGSPAQVATSEETLHMSFERKFARQWRLMNSPVFGALSWVLALFVPHRKGFGTFRQSADDDPQAAEQFAALDSKELLQLSKAIDSPQVLPREETKVPEARQNPDAEEGLAKESPDHPEFPDLALFIAGGVWSIESIEETPEVRLDDWLCFELQMERRAGRSRHLVGSTGRDRHGQVSSAICAMDPGTRKCTTKSGRVYELGPRNGFTADGEYTWRQWIRINQASGIVDVTDEIRKLLAGAA